MRTFLASLLGTGFERMGDTRLIERWLPIAEIGIESTRERTPMTPFPAPNRLLVGAGRVPEERVKHGQVLDRAEVKEPGRVAATAPLAGEDPIDDRAGGANCRADLSSLFPAPHAEIALGGAVVERERFGISGTGCVGVAHDGDDAALGQAGEARVGGRRRGWEKEGCHRGEGEKQARHRLPGRRNTSSFKPHVTILCTGEGKNPRRGSTLWEGIVRSVKASLRCMAAIPT